VHPSKATRACDKLVQGCLLHRSDDAADRRNVILRLTESGQYLVHTVMENRRSAIAAILTKMLVQQRRSLVLPLQTFVDIAREIPSCQAWGEGWTTTDPHGAHKRRQIIQLTISRRMWMHSTVKH
jgi:hypothetical protein